MSHTRSLATFLARLSYADLPEAVLARSEDLFLDWLGFALASQGAHPIPLFERYAATMGPTHGPATLLVNGLGTSAYFAALVNAASSHLVEQDDLHNSSVLHPATVVFPAVLAAAQDLGKSGAELLLAAVAGYEAGIRIGEFLGRSHYRIFHTTATVGTQAAGLWEFLRDAADSPDNTLSRAELEDKFRRLLAFAGELNGDQAGVLIARVWALRDALNLKGLMENIHEQ